MKRKELYRRFLRAKGRYSLFYIVNLTTMKEKMFNEANARKIMMDWIEKGDEVRFRCAFSWDIKRGDDFELWYRERAFDWNPILHDFILAEEKDYRGE